MLVACCDQDFGISTSRCSKTTSPRSLPMTAERSSHSISSNGSTPGSVKKRGNSSPAAAAFLARGLSASEMASSPRFHRCRPSAGRHWQLEKQRAPSCFNSQFAPGIAGERPTRSALSVAVSLLWIWRPVTRSWDVLGEMLVALRPSNMRPRIGFVNSDPTRYCAFLLGQSQDVDACGYLWKSPPSRKRSRKEGQVGGVFRHPPVVHRQGKGGGVFPSAGCGRNEVVPVKKQARCHGTSAA